MSHIKTNGDVLNLAFGEAVASPNIYTLLGRLENLIVKSGSTITELDSLNEIHNALSIGRKYQASNLFDFTAGLVANYQINTGTRTIHLLGTEVSAETGPVSYVCRENPVFTTGSFVVPCVNQNRAIVNNAQTTIFSDATGVSGGTVVKQYYVQLPILSGSDMDNKEMILNPNSTYIFVVTNGSATNNQIMIKWIFWEEF